MAITIGTLSYQITADTQKFTSGLVLTKKELRDAKKVAEATKTPHQKYGDEIAKLNALAKKGAISQAQYNAAVKQASDRANAAAMSSSKFGGAMQSVVRAGAAAAAAAIAALGAALIQALREMEAYNRVFAKSTAIMGGLSDTLENDLRMKSKQVAFQLSQDSKEVAAGYEFLAAAGLDAQKSLAAIGTTSTFARAGSMDLALATDLLTDAQSALGLANKDTRQHMVNMRFVANQLAGAYQTSNASIEQFSQAITTGVGPALRALKKDLQEGLGVLKVWASTGFAKGEEAGTQFEIVLRDLQKAAVNESKAWEQAGLSLFNAQGNVRNLADIIEQLTNRFSNLSDEDMTKEFMKLGFTFKSLRSVKSLLGLADDMRIAEEQARATGEVLDDIAQKKVTALEKATKQASETWKLFTTELLTNPMTSMTEAGQGSISALAEGLVIVLDTADAIGLAIKGWQAFILLAEQGFRLSVDGIINKVKRVAELLNNLPGVEIDVTALGDENKHELLMVGDKLAKLGQEINDSLTAQSSGEKFRKMIEQLNTPLETPGGTVSSMTDRIVEQQQEMDEATKKAAASAKKTADAVESVTSKLQEQIATYKMSADEIELWKLEQEGATETQLKLVKGMQSFLQSSKDFDKMLEDAAERQKQLAEIREEATKFADDVQRRVLGIDTSGGSINRGSEQAARLEFQQANPQIAKQIKEGAKQTKILAEIRDLNKNNPPIKVAKINP